MAEDLTVLIGSLGGSQNLLACLRSIYAGARGTIAFRVVVGFNHEGYSEAPETLRREFPAVEQLRAGAKLGYCRSYNQMMARGVGRYVLLLDDDTVLRPGCLDDIVGFMDAHGDVGIAGCRTTNPDGSYQKTTALMFDLKSELHNMVRPSAFWRDGVDGSVTDWRSVGWLNGHFLAVRSEVIRQVGLLDERYYTFQCEADWCLRIARAGWKVAYAPQVEVMHVGGAHSVTSRVKSRKNIVRGHINRYYFFRKHYPGWPMAAFRLIMSFGALIRCATYCAVWLLKPARRPEASPKIAAFWEVALLGLSPNPERLPEDLRRENDVFGSFEPSVPT